jgi:hypothetical protein
MVEGLTRDGWTVLPYDPATAAWAEVAHRVALEVTGDPAMRARWLRHDGTWFVGVDALPNGPDGAIDGQPLPEVVAVWLARHVPLHRAQLSVVHPGYPGRDPGESAAGHAFRRDRDAAHLDGLLPEGPARRRHLREPHALILGVPLTPVTARTSPFVVWEGSHHIMRAAMAAAFAGHTAEDWGDVDVTEAYQAARAQVFATCPRRVVLAEPGQVILAHRLTIHGVAPWPEEAASEGPTGGRMIAWFRPVLADVGQWVAQD